MSRFMTGNLFLALSMLCAASSQVVLKALLDDVRPQTLDWPTIQLFLAPGRLWRGCASLTLVVMGFAFWVLCLTRLNLSYAYPIACTSVLIVALLSMAFLGEPMTPRMWIGTGLVLVAIILLAPPS
jgi:drug/metabolite transporter (DMT)-like permease